MRKLFWRCLMNIFYGLEEFFFGIEARFSRLAHKAERKLAAIIKNETEDEILCLLNAHLRLQERNRIENQLDAERWQ